MNSQTIKNQYLAGWVTDVLKLIWNSYAVLCVNMWVKSENKCHH